MLVTFGLAWLFASGARDPHSRGTSANNTPATPDPAAAIPWPAETDFPGRGPIQTNEWFRARWSQLRYAWKQNRDKETNSVVFLGDSITERWLDLDKYFPGLKVANRGISADTSRGLRARLQDVMDLDPVAVVLLIGTNDIGMDADPAVVAENIKAIVDTLVTFKPIMPIVVCRVMPRGIYPNYFPDRLIHLNELLDYAFKGYKQVRICDTWTIFATRNGGVRRSEFPDFLHPNAAGYAKWAAALKTIFRDLKLMNP